MSFRQSFLPVQTRQAYSDRAIPFCIKRTHLDFCFEFPLRLIALLLVTKPFHGIVTLKLEGTNRELHTTVFNLS